MTDGFATGRYGFIIDGPWKISELREGYPDFKYGTADIPKGKGGSVSVLGGESISIFNNSKQSKEAWEFAKFMTSEFAQNEMVKADQIPVNKKTLETKEVKESNFSPFLESIKTAKSRPTVPGWTEIDDSISTTMTNIMNDKVTVKDGLDNLSEHIDEILSRGE